MGKKKRGVGPDISTWQAAATGWRLLYERELAENRRLKDKLAVIAREQDEKR